MQTEIISKEDVPQSGKLGRPQAKWISDFIEQFNKLEDGQALKFTFDTLEEAIV